MNTERLNAEQKAFWQSYLHTLPAADCPSEGLVRADMPGNEALADELLSLYLSGKKTAGSSLVRSFDAGPDPWPAIGEH